MGSKTSAHLILNTICVRLRQFKSSSALKKWLSAVLITLVVIATSIYAIDRWVSWKSQDDIISDISQVPKFQVAVVLGTSKYLGRTLNEYYSHRIEAAIKLYEQGTVSRFLLSGDNAHRSYNEPWTMKRDLLKAGVPESNIHLDYAGFRTLDSIVRAKRIFDTDNFLIVTQRFHCERALFIAKYHDIKATCLAVAGPTKPSGNSVRIREIFARTKAFLDLYIFNVQPKFLGPKEPIIVEPVQEPSDEEATNLSDNVPTQSGDIEE